MKDIITRITEWLGLTEAPEGDDLSGFSDEQLQEIKAKARGVVSAAREKRDITAANEAEKVFVAASEALANRKSTDADFASIEKRMEDPPAPEPEPTPASEPETPPATPEPAPAAPEASAPTPAPAPEVTPPAAPVTAGGAPVPDPSQAPSQSLVRLTASGDVRGHSAGADMPVSKLGEAFVAKADGFARAQKPGRSSVAVLEWEYPEERNLSLDDAAHITDGRIAPLVAAAQERTRNILEQLLDANAEDVGSVRQLTAAGGLCAPVNVRYDIFTLGTDVRPLRDSLLRFGANRGGIHFNEPPTLVDVDGAAAVYEEDQDASGADYPKDCLIVDCGDEVTVKVGAVTLCMTVGNFQRLSFPENFQAWWGLGRVLHARTAETRLWNKLTALGLDVSFAGQVSFLRDVFAGVATAAAQYRDRHRIADDTPLRVHMPTWVIDLAMIDLSRQAPGDNVFAKTRADIARYFAALNIAVTFIKDGQSASQGGGYTQGAGALNKFPTTLEVLISVDGTLLFLDMGRLDFGTEIRDFDMIRANDSGAFFETFENVANVGPDFLHLTFDDLCPNGQTAGPDATITCTGS